MFKVGDYIMYGQKGVCRVGELTQLEIKENDGERLCYIIYPINDERSRVYFPVEGVRPGVRKVMTKKEVTQLLDDMKNIDIINSDDRTREEAYKKAIMGSDCRDIVRVIKTIYIHKQERLRLGKKITSTDARYLKQAEDKLYGEMAFVLGKQRAEMEEYILHYIEG